MPDLNGDPHPLDGWTAQDLEELVAAVQNGDWGPIDRAIEAGLFTVAPWE